MSVSIAVRTDNLNCLNCKVTVTKNMVNAVPNAESSSC